jgi:hypothetical protein|tara:strand:- start:239 stop:583 length:345 start_codon:yes stop_codon:yes gene_type:complete
MLMRFNFWLLLVLLALSLPSFGETLDELEYRKGMYYRINSGTPYTGQVDGKHQGLLINGIREGAWISHWRNGEVSSQGSYQNGKKDGFWNGYTKDGAVDVRLTGTYKNGVKIID